MWYSLYLVYTYFDFAQVIHIARIHWIKSPLRHIFAYVCIISYNYKYAHNNITCTCCIHSLLYALVVNPSTSHHTHAAAAAPSRTIVNFMYNILPQIVRHNITLIPAFVARYMVYHYKIYIGFNCHDLRVP